MNRTTKPLAQPQTVRVHRTWQAMATRFDAQLVGSDAEHLETVAAAIEEEVHRLDALLSRYNPTSEISRLNRHAAAGPARADADVWQLLHTAEFFRQATAGFFDVTATSATPVIAPRIELDAARQTVRFASADVAIDLGAIGKGFALDRAKEWLARFGVDSALVSAGTSSILAVGRPPNAAAWAVDVRHPADDTAGPIGRVELADRSLSCSAAVGPGQAVSDIVNPHAGLPLAGGDAVVVLAAEGAQAEALSTALLAMGRRRATEYLAHSDWNKLSAKGQNQQGLSQICSALEQIGTVPFSQRFCRSALDVAWADGSGQTQNLEWLVRSHD